jgi:ethanolamine utilization protein EutA
VVEAVTTRELAKLTRELLMTAPLRLDYPVETVMISGGVADYVYSDYTPLAVSDISRYGDIGPLLGWSLREAFQARGIELAKPVETIRATVIGAGTHSVNISGSTIHVNESTLPLRNVTVVSPFAGGTPETREKIAAELQRCVERLTQDGSAQHVALSIEGPRTETFADIEVLADGIVQGMEGYLQSKRPLVLVLQKDCAKVLGQCLQLRLKQGAEIVCIDQVQVDEGDYIDIGKPLLGGRVVPVVVKTLVFESSGKKNLKA